ncbi:MAG: phosphoenolpyruvate--protein phosphotransferase [Deltaproteobacteria bacterium]|nr:MAG: phosphoenolpyruvate--protein phosphotransferase [Deltaproteobacteria bacterium]
MVDSSRKNLTLQGIAASPGIAIGKAYLFLQDDLSVIEKRLIERDEVGTEISRFKHAVEKARQQLHEIIQELPDEFRVHAYILDSHIMLLKDRMLYDGTIEQIEQKNVNAEWALKIAVQKIKAIFKEIPNRYHRERASDVVHVSKLIFENLLGAESLKISDIDKRGIIVAHDLSPAETTQIQLEKVKAFVTDLGGQTSHTAIIARSLEIPAVLGIGNATRQIETNDLIIVDGSTGAVILDPDEETLAQYHDRKDLFEKFHASVTRISHLPAETTDGHRLTVSANIELFEEVASVIDHGADGIGLYRTEFLYVNRPILPSEEELFNNYREVAEIMGPREVTIRTLDIGGDKFASGLPLAEEMNPALGLRAIRFCLQSPEIFQTQIRAILRASAFGNIRIMFPMISQVEELVSAKRLLDEVAESLDREGIPFKHDLEVGAMIEVPSAVIMADVLAREVDFFSIGTNDLIQYSLAIDRINKHVAGLYQPLHPAMLRMIRRVVEAAKEADIEVSLCGEMAGDPANLPVLLGLELDSLSMNPVSIPVIKNLLRKLSFSESKLFLEEALKQPTTADVLKLIQLNYGKSFEEVTFAARPIP